MRFRLMATYRGVPYEVGVGPSNSDVVLFAACPPPEELGFQPAPGHWRKHVIRAEVDVLWESRPIGIFHGEPCLVLDDLGDRLHITYLGKDGRRARELGYWQVDRGVFELLTPREEVSGLTEEKLEKSLPRAAGAAPMPSYPYGSPQWPPPPAAASVPPDVRRRDGGYGGDPALAPAGARNGTGPRNANGPPAGTGSWDGNGRPAGTGPRNANGTAGGTGPRNANGTSAGPGPRDANGSPAGSGPWNGTPPGTGPWNGDGTPAGTGPWNGNGTPAGTGPWNGNGTPAGTGPWNGNGNGSGPNWNANGAPGGAPNWNGSPGAPGQWNGNGSPGPVTGSNGPGANGTGGWNGTAAGVATVPAGAGPPGAGPGGSPAPNGPLDTPASARRRPSPPAGRRSARRQRVQTRSIFSELADLAAIPRSAYALEQESDGAICLLRTEEGFEVFSAADGARHEVRSFEDEEAAYFYLFGVLAAEAVRNGSLTPPR
jgi:hypothetical protein